MIKVPTLINYQTVLLSSALCDKRSVLRRVSNLVFYAQSTIAIISEGRQFFTPTQPCVAKRQLGVARVTEISDRSSLLCEKECHIYTNRRPRRLLNIKKEEGICFGR